MPRYRHESVIDAPPEAVFDWHARPGAFERLAPPWSKVRVVDQSGRPPEPGASVTLEVGPAPFARRWVAVHGDWVPGRQFVDEQVSGPFRQWRHTHRFEAEGLGTRLIDDVEFALPGGPLGRLGLGLAHRELARMFAYRHRVTRTDVDRHARYGGAAMKVLMSGSSGLVGGALRGFLGGGGHEVVRLLRRPTGDGDATSWDPATGTFADGALDGVDAVVHLAGENIAGGRWTAARKARIRDSRVDDTRRLAEGLAALETPPKVLVAASAVGYYGARGDETLDETAAPGTGFLPEVCEAWEAALDPARARGIRVVPLRIGIVLTPAGGALAQMLLPFRLGVGGVLGSGEQYMSWIALDDLVAIAAHCLTDESIREPVNAVAPQPVTNREFTKTLGRVLGRPTVFPMPGVAARVVFGEMADALLLTGARIVPTRLERAGFSFGYPDLESALRHVLGRG